MASLGVSLFLPGCPLTDNYFTRDPFAAAGQSGTSSGASGLGATAGATGALSGAGGDPASSGAASGGTTSAGAPSIGAAGEDVASGGTAGSDAGNGGRAGEPTAGNTATGGTSAAGGAPPSAGSAGANPFFQPLCDEAIVKGSPCDASSVQVCYRRCGPDSIGYKSETCQFGSYMEQSGCSFPTAANYSCYKIPPSLPKECPGTVPRAAQECQVSTCIACFGGNVNNPQYQDSTGMQKEGYCVCSSAGLWTCASTTSWPCPDGAGCD